MEIRTRVVCTTLTVMTALGAVASPATAAEFDRIGGSDRYETAVLISQRAFPTGAATVLLTSGEDYPDALSGGAAGAAIGAPVLLTRTGSLPAVVAAELDRLNPKTIVVLGGKAAVAEGVIAAATTYAGNVERIGGADRYETAALVADWAFDPGVPAAYLASGTDFPDALAGAAAAGHRGGPVLLTKPSSLSDATAHRLGALDPAEIVVLGGPSAVSPTVETALGSYAPVSRVAGGDRYATSAAVSADTFASAATVYIATGGQFADALAAGPLAAGTGSPVLLVNDSVSRAVCDEIGRLGPRRVVAIGSSYAVTEGVATWAAALCALPELEPGPEPTPIPLDPPPSPTTN